MEHSQNAASRRPSGVQGCNHRYSSTGRDRECDQMAARRRGTPVRSQDAATVHALQSRSQLAPAPTGLAARDRSGPRDPLTPLACDAFPVRRVPPGHRSSRSPPQCRRYRVPRHASRVRTTGSDGYPFVDKFRHLFAYTDLVFLLPPTRLHDFTICCKDCGANIPAPVETMPSSWIVAQCPLCGGKRPYLPNDIFRGRLSKQLASVPVRRVAL